MELTRQLLDKRAYENGTELSVELPEYGMRLNREVVQLRQIAFNMLADAIHRARAGGQVSLTATAFSGTGLELRTIETGPDSEETVLDQIVSESLSLSLIRRMVAQEGGVFDVMHGDLPGQIVSVCRFENILAEAAPDRSTEIEGNEDTIHGNTENSLSPDEEGAGLAAGNRSL